MTDYQSYGALAGSLVGAYTNILGMKDDNKTIDKWDNEGELLKSSARMMNYNRELIDRQLGDVLSANALETAKNMATAKVLQSKSGTVGGTSAAVSKQHYITQIQADADAITQARHSERRVLMDNLSKQISFRNKSVDYTSNIKSPMEALIGSLSASIGGATAGANLGTKVEGAKVEGAMGAGSQPSPYSGVDVFDGMNIIDGVQY